MLATPVLLGTTPLTENASWWLNAFGDTTLRTTATPITPHDPSSLTLALIGIGIMVVYLAVKRRPRNDRTHMIHQLRKQSRAARPAVDAEERRSRGAA